MMLQDVLPPVHWMPPRRCGSLIIVGLRCEGTVPTEPSTLDFAMRRRDLRIDELPEGPQVPLVEARNGGQRPVLMLAGEELIGARQNRILNASVWLDAQGSARVPVSCVEQGRWSEQRRGGFRSASTMYFPSGMRAHTRLVGEGYRGQGTAHGDQSGVWNDVRTRLQSVGARSATQSMHTVYAEADADRLEEYATALRGEGGQRGFAAFVHGALVGLEIFCSPAYFSAVYNKYLRAYALDKRLGRRRSSRSSRAFEVSDLDDLLQRVREMPASTFRSAGVGRDVRFECSRFHGSALLLPLGRGRRGLGHFSLFTAE